jgi:Na+-translocating ferredoxin:NAD+ oxidoreductase RnfD subunit
VSSDVGRSQVEAPAPGAAARITAWYRGLNAKHLVTFLNTLILVLAEWQFGGLGGYDRLAVSLGACIATEIGLSLLVLGRMPVSYLSPYISGVSLSLLLKPQYGLLWPFAIGGLVAISSKYVLRYRGGHLWNPTNLSISLLLLLAAPVLTKLTHEWGNSLVANLIIWSVGLIVVHRARLLHVTVTYALSFVALAGLRAAASSDLRFLTELAPLTGPMYQLFVFFMITDPPTVVSKRRGRILVAFLIALCEAVIRTGLDLEVAWLAPLAPAPALFALAIVGPLAKVIDRRRAS